MEKEAALGIQTCEFGNERFTRAENIDDIC